MAGAYTWMHGEKEWFEIDEAVRDIATAVEKLEESQYSIRVSEEEASRLIHDAIQLLRSVTFVEEELGCRGGDCASCHADEEEAA